MNVAAPNRRLPRPMRGPSVCALQPSAACATLRHRQQLLPMQNPCGQSIRYTQNHSSRWSAQHFHQHRRNCGKLLCIITATTHNARNAAQEAEASRAANSPFHHAAAINTAASQKCSGGCIDRLPANHVRLRQKGCVWPDSSSPPLAGNASVDQTWARHFSCGEQRILLSRYSALRKPRG